MVQRSAGVEVVAIDWDEVRIRGRGSDSGDEVWRVELPDPLETHRAAFSRAGRAGGSLMDVLSSLGAERMTMPAPRRCPCGCGRLLLSAGNGSAADRRARGDDD
jgi:hypothetical protein